MSTIFKQILNSFDAGCGPFLIETKTNSGDKYKNIHGSYTKGSYKYYTKYSWNIETLSSIMSKFL